LYLELMGRGARQFLHTRWIRDGMECGQTLRVQGHCEYFVLSFVSRAVVDCTWSVPLLRARTHNFLFFRRLFQVRDVGLIYVLFF
jgi:hypothetical protein